jgi:hypothetical protein
MSDHITLALAQIADHDEKAAFHLGEARRLRSLVNDLDRLENKDPRFPDIESSLPPIPSLATLAAARAAKTWEAGEFFGKPFAASAKAILMARYEAAGKPAPASVDDIRDALLQGTYDFGTTNADQQKQGIRIALGKNSAAFVKLPNTDLFGLVEWYGQRPRRQRPRINDPETPAAADEADGEETAVPAAAPEAA